MRFDEKGLGLTPEEMIALLDVKRETAIKCRHYDGVIPCLPRIFTTNLDCSGQQHPFVRGASRAQVRLFLLVAQVVPTIALANH